MTTDNTRIVAPWDPIHLPGASPPLGPPPTLAELTQANTLALQRVALELHAVSEQLALVGMAGERLAEVGEAIAAGMAGRAALSARRENS